MHSTSTNLRRQTEVFRRPNSGAGHAGNRPFSAKRLLAEYGRVVMVPGQRTFTAVPYAGSGYIGSESQCVRQLTTEQIGNSATPESWRIRQVNANGPGGGVISDPVNIVKLQDAVAVQ